MKVISLTVLLATVVFTGKAMAGVIMDSTEMFPSAAPTWGSVPHGDPTGWQTAKSSWGKVACTFGGNGDIPSHTADGSAVLRIKYTSGQGSGVAAIQFATTPGTNYTLAGFVQANNIAGWTEYQLVDGADWSGWDSGGFCDVLTLPAVNTWHQFGKTVQATGSTMTIVMKAGTNTSQYTTVYWDDITVTPEPAVLGMLLPGAALLLRRRRA